MKQLSVPQRPHINWRALDWLYYPLAAFAITRLTLFFAAYLSEIAFAESGAGGWHAVADNVFLDVWARFDSGFYLRIVQEGYLFKLGEKSNVAFFPVYPLLTDWLVPLVGQEVLAGVIVSNLCLLGALIFLYRLTKLEFDDASTARRTVYYIAAFPTAFFFSAVYTESAFLLWIVGTMYFARRRLWVWAALFGLLTAATRIVGVITFGMVGLEWLRSHGWTISTCFRPEAWWGLLRGLRTDWPSLLVIFVIPLGLLSYMLFLQRQFQDPVAFWTVQAAWGREDLGPVAIIWRDVSGLISQNFFTGKIWWHVLLDVGAFFAVLILSVFVWFRLGEAYAIFCLLSVLIPVSSGTGSMTRYALILFPLFMILGWWGRIGILDRAIMIGFSVFLGIFTAIFANWIFIA
ncbi:MAG: hypothetical protein KDJ97_00335 [Anaerolineae bacterium]|nr:hypothetical protein [Anaerolineae bacterium]